MFVSGAYSAAPKSRWLQVTGTPSKSNQALITSGVVMRP